MLPVADSGQADTEAKEEKDDEEGLGDMKEEDRTPQLGSIKEEDVGITEYISQHRGVSAVIKQRSVTTGPCLKHSCTSNTHKSVEMMCNIFGRVEVCVHVCLCKVCMLTCCHIFSSSSLSVHFFLSVCVFRNDDSSNRDADFPFFSVISGPIRSPI